MVGTIADENDAATLREMQTTEVAVDAVRRRAAKIPVGVPGECDLCGEWSGRLVFAACAPCRDKYKIK